MIPLAQPRWHLRQGKDLLVLIPGALMPADDFVAEGLLDALNASPLSFDVMVSTQDPLQIRGVADFDALLNDELRSARMHYRKLWLGGISLGAFWAMSLLAAHPGCADGLCLMAPYPGSRPTLNAIARAGGLTHWQPDPVQLADAEFRLWQWLKSPPADMQVFAGYGEDDRFAAGMRQLVDCFAPRTVCTVPGGHEWPAWRSLWMRFLERGCLGGA